MSYLHSQVSFSLLLSTFNSTLLLFAVKLCSVTTLSILSLLFHSSTSQGYSPLLSSYLISSLIFFTPNPVNFISTIPTPSHSTLSHPILSHPILPHPILSYPILSYPILSYPILSYPILSYTILSYTLLSYPKLSYPILSYPILSYPILSYPILSYTLLSYPILSSPILSYPILSYPILSSPILSYPLLSYPILSYHLLSFTILSYPLITYPILSYPMLSYPLLSYPILSYPALFLIHIISLLTSLTSTFFRIQSCSSSMSLITSPTPLFILIYFILLPVSFSATFPIIYMPINVDSLSPLHLFSSIDLCDPFFTFPLYSPILLYI